MKPVFSVISICVVVSCAVEPPDTVDTDDLHVTVPLPGLRVWSEVIFVDGHTRTLEVRTLDDGAVDVVEDEAAAADAAAASTSPDPCSDRGFSLMGHRWDRRFDWWFKASTTPGELDKDATEAALRRGTSNITTSKNSCGLGDLVGATQRYQGRTSTGSQVRSDGVVLFGDLPPGVLGVACVWSTADGVAVESDVKLNKNDFSWTTTTGDTCHSGRFDVESVMTHERGHTFGLGHVDEGGHGRLTMSTAINGACQASERTLGRGDVVGLRALY